MRTFNVIDFIRFGGFSETTPCMKVPAWEFSFNTTDSFKTASVLTPGPTVEKRKQQQRLQPPQNYRISFEFRIMWTLWRFFLHFSWKALSRTPSSLKKSLYNSCRPNLKTVQTYKCSSFKKQKKETKKEHGCVPLQCSVLHVNTDTCTEAELDNVICTALKALY